MGDHLALLVNRLLTESTLQAAIESRNRAKQVDEDSEIEYLAPKLEARELSSPKKLVECRICQDEDFDSNMETPCSCRGSLKFAHRRCVQRWCNEKGDTVCEICHQPFKPGYRAPPPLLGYHRHIPINIRRNWQMSRRDLNEERFIETVSLSSDFDDQPSSRTFIFRLAVAIIFIGLVILRHTLPILVGGDEFVFSLFILAALRIAGILLLVYVTIRAVTGLRRHRHQEEMESSESDTSDTSSDEETEQEDQQQVEPSHSHVIQIP